MARIQCSPSGMGMGARTHSFGDPTPLFDFHPYLGTPGYAAGISGSYAGANNTSPWYASTQGGGKCYLPYAGISNNVFFGGGMSPGLLRLGSMPVLDYNGDRLVGMILEATSTNYFTRSTRFDLLGNAGGGGDTYADSGISLLGDGTNSRQVSFANLGSYSKLDFFGVNSSSIFASVWHRTPSGTLPAGGGTSFMNVLYLGGALSTAWAKYRGGPVSSPGTNFNQGHFFNAAIGTVIMDAFMVEVSQWHSVSPIPTTGASNTRDPEAFRFNPGGMNPNSWIPSGHLRMSFEAWMLAPRSAFSSGTKTIFEVIDGVASAALKVNMATMVATFNVGGVSVTCPTNFPSWNEYDLVEVWVEAGNVAKSAALKVRVNKGSVTTLGTWAAGTFGNVANTDSNLSMWQRYQSGAVEQINCVIRRCRAFASTDRLTWAS